MNHSSSKRSMVLTLAGAMVNLSLTVSPVAYATEPAAAATKPYYDAGRQSLPPHSVAQPMSAAPADPTYNQQDEVRYTTPRTRPSPTLDQMVVDGLVMRPVMLVATVLGTGVFLVTLPASALGGNVGDAARKLVVEPAESTFTSCLGCIFERNQSKYESWH